MAGKLDKVSGVFILYMDQDDCKYAYLGKSSGVGVAKRSATSKLRKNKFHNNDFQDDFRRFGGQEFLYEEIVLCKENEDIRETYDRTRDELLDDGWILYNDVEIIHDTEVITESELSHLTSYERDFVELVINKIRDVDIDYLTGLINGENKNMF